jgi:hypothetical protein
MSPILLILLIVFLCGGFGYVGNRGAYGPGYYGGGGLGVIVVILLILWAAGVFGGPVAHLR